MKTTNTDHFPIAVSDGAGGSIILFERSGISSDIYAQKINGDGTLAWGGLNAPVPVCNAASDQYSIHAMADGAGGAFLCWYDFRHNNDSAEIYCQRINSAGVSQWTTNGVRLTNTPDLDEFEPFLCGDGAGGIIVAWNWERLDNDLQISAQRVDATGSILWPANGVQVCLAPGFRYGQGIIPDGSNGAILAFQDTRNDPSGIDYALFAELDMVNYDIFAQRLSGTGTRLWCDNAIAVCTSSGNQENYYLSTIVPDGNGGAVIAFDDFRNDVLAGGLSTNVDIYAQRINGAGQLQWDMTGIPITTGAGNQYFSGMVADGANGFVLTWNNNATGQVYSQRLSATGASEWAANGIRISPNTNTSVNPVLAADGNGNYVYTYKSLQSNTMEAQKVNLNGDLQWSSGGILLCSAPGAQPANQKMVLSDNGAVLVAWEDKRTNATTRTDIYGSKILSSGILAGLSAYVTIANGAWNDPAIWQGGLVPATNSQVTVRHSVDITGNASCYSLLIEQPGGNLTLKPGINLTVTH